jgi:hypothetical protein
MYPRGCYRNSSTRRNATADVGEELPVGDDQRPEPVGTVSEIEASIERERGGDA